MNWIPVDKVMPAEMMEVLTFDETRGIIIGYYFKETNCFIGTVDGVRIHNARFWMPLPTVPGAED